MQMPRRNDALRRHESQPPWNTDQDTVVASFEIDDFLDEALRQRKAFVARSQNERRNDRRREWYLQVDRGPESGAVRQRRRTPDKLEFRTDDVETGASAENASEPPRRAGAQGEKTMRQRSVSSSAAPSSREPRPNAKDRSRIALKSSPRPSSATSMETIPASQRAKTSMTPTSGLPRRRRSSGNSTP